SAEVDQIGGCQVVKLSTSENLGENGRNHPIVKTARHQIDDTLHRKACFTLLQGAGCCQFDTPPMAGMDNGQ
ncbi:MAG TPA: hypothetical protein VLA12_01510, partial [Planctomycetaceae bacterium]|nr:hypothetical protein [Planctomycetaceae bacterium]